MLTVAAEDPLKEPVESPVPNVNELGVAPGSHKGMDQIPRYARRAAGGGYEKGAGSFRRRRLSFR